MLQQQQQQQFATGSRVFVDSSVVYLSVVSKMI